MSPFQGTHSVFPAATQKIIPLFLRPFFPPYRPERLILVLSSPPHCCYLLCLCWSELWVADNNPSSQFRQKGITWSYQVAWCVSQRTMEGTSLGLGKPPSKLTITSLLPCRPPSVMVGILFIIPGVCCSLGRHPRLLITMPADGVLF